MNRVKLLTIAAIAILMAGALASVAAQKQSPITVVEPIIDLGIDPFIEPDIKPLRGTYTIELSATELSAGDTEYAMAETYGWTCYGKTAGDLSGFMFISMNYSVPEYLLKTPEPKSSIAPPQPISPTSRITGGSWSKLIFNRGVYVGSVHGRIIGGTMTWSKTDLSAQLSIELSADDGTGSFAGNVGKGAFEGLLDYSSKAGVGTISGLLTLHY